MFSLKDKKIILASASPRRLELLRQIGIEPEIRVSEAEELKEMTETPEALVMENAYRKAAASLRSGANEIIIAADTIVVQDNKVFGKPHSEEEARAMLRSLSDREHQVYTGCCVINGLTEESVTGCSMTTVIFDPLSDEMIDDYIATKEPNDKAGAYGIQGKGGIFVRRIEGDYGTVVGLSLPLLKDLLQELED